MESSREGGGPEDEAEAEPEADPEPEAVEPKSDPSGSWACASEVGHFCALVVGGLGCLPFLSAYPLDAILTCLHYPSMYV